MASTQAAAARGTKRAYEPDDSNADIIDPLERKRRKEEASTLKEEAAHTPKVSGKKKKRLDAYIARKLKKEDRKDLIASLAQTQTSSLALRSSSTLGSKQYTDQSAKLTHGQAVETSRRARAQRILQDKKGRGHHSAGESESESESEAESEVGPEGSPMSMPGKMDVVEPHDPQPVRSTQTLASKLAPTFNASGSLGLVEVASSPVASTSRSASVASARPPPLVGSGLRPGAVVNLVRRRKKEKGKLKALVAKASHRGMGKTRESSAEEQSSEFDSSQESGEGDEDGTTSEAESWAGIDDNVAEATAVASHAEGDEEDDHDDRVSTDDDDELLQPGPPRQRGSFQAWADARILAASGLDSPSAPSLSINSSDYDPYVPLVPSGSQVPQSTALPSGITGPLGAHLPRVELPSMPIQRTTHIHFERSEEMQKKREGLPVVKEEAMVMDAVRGNPVVVLCGETGSGKTTQIGQFLLEAGWGDASSDNPGLVAITQPRRVAALSTSQRVREELGLPRTSSLVGHRIRYSSNTAPDTKLVFMTDGVLLRELASDFLLTKYSVVVVDEAHERGVNTDVLIGVLSRVAKLRETMWRTKKEDIKPLRLIIMSATLRVSDFAENPTLFPKAPPVLHINARQHPVTIHYSRKTSPHYLEEAYKKVARIHTRLPPGGILVFCTGQNEIVSLVKKLEGKYSERAVKERKRKSALAKERMEARSRAITEKRGVAEAEAESDQDEDDGGAVEYGDDMEVEEVELGAEEKDLTTGIDDGLPLDDDPDNLESSDDEDDLKISGFDMEADSDEPMHVLPLYSLLPTDKQMRVFEDPPVGFRLVVVATNVAETAITIPNIKYVVDTGRAKERRFNADSGIQSFEVSWISKAGAAQRTGRAGRTGPGHCYRLYSSAVYENYFDLHNKPEILRMPIEGVVLQMKSMNIDAVANFPFPTPPDRDSLRRAEKTLVHLGALEPSESASKVGGKITELGKSMALFPLSPRFSKMIVAGQQHGCLPFVIAIVCALSVGDPFIREANLGDGEQESPVLDTEKVLTSAEIGHIRNPELRAKAELQVARKAFFDVHSKYLALGRGSSDVFKVLSVVGAYEYEGGRDSFCPSNFVRTKAMQEIHKLRSQISRIVQSTYPGIDAGFVPKLQPPSEVQLKVLRQLIASAFIDQVAIRKDLVHKGGVSYSKVASTRGVPYRCLGIDEDLFIHPSSGLFHSAPPEFIVYQDLHRTSKVWLKTVTKINSAWLPVLGRPLCSFSKPIETPESAVAVKLKSTVNATSRKTFVVPRFGDVELKPIQVEQSLVNGRWVMR